MSDCVKKSPLNPASGKNSADASVCRKNIAFLFSVQSLQLLGFGDGDGKKYCKSTVEWIEKTCVYSRQVYSRSYPILVVFSICLEYRKIMPHVLFDKNDDIDIML